MSNRLVSGCIVCNRDLIPNEDGIFVCEGCDEAVENCECDSLD